LILHPLSTKESGSGKLTFTLFRKLLRSLHDIITTVPELNSLKGYRRPDEYIPLTLLGADGKRCRPSEVERVGGGWLCPVVESTAESAAPGATFRTSTIVRVLSRPAHVD
jgi:hypothetical protein